MKVREVRCANAVPMSQKKTENYPPAPSYGRNGFLSVGSLTDRTGPQLTKRPPAPPRNGHTPGPRDTWNPKQGSLGPHLARKQIWSAGVSLRTAPKTGKIHFLVFLARFRPRTGRRNFSKSPRHPKISKSRIAATGGQTIGSHSCTKIAQRERDSDEPKKS